MKKNQKLNLVDGSSYLFRAFHGMPEFSTSKGEPCGAIYGVINMIKRLQRDYPGDMVLKNGKTFIEQFGPRGVMHSWNEDGKQRIEDTGPLTKKRMETVDDETSDRAIAFIREQHAAGTPWFGATGQPPE